VPSADAPNGEMFAKYKQNKPSKPQTTHKHDENPFVRSYTLGVEVSRGVRQTLEQGLNTCNSEYVRIVSNVNG